MIPPTNLPALHNTQVPNDQHPPPQQLQATARQTHVLPPESPYRLPYHLLPHQHTQLWNYRHDSGAQLIHLLSPQQQQVPPTGDL